MSKGKLAKFADMASYPHVFECPMKHIKDMRATDELPTSAPSTATSPSATAKIMEVDFPLRGRWREDFFKNDNPIILELGCGRGEYAVGLARRYPEQNFIGVDIKGARMWSGATEALQEGLKNVAFLRTNIEIIDQFFAPGEVKEIWLTFSDPQMKKPTKRLTSTYFLARYRRFLEDGGTVHLKTDSNFLFTYTRYVVETNKLPMEVCTEDLYGDSVQGATNSESGGGLRGSDKDESGNCSSLDLNIRTYYEQQWLSRGLTIKYMRFRLPQEGALTEPNVEIEMDDYRSYNRDKRSSLEVSC
ncbi:MAG: tRNA (guanosine(46)-N7)-methyltransferase TrmB [Bacteroidaceae bacterium]|nr:tRNA (guanosine(46)-N7)-methyltransferase TrmB [Bacteroidaceae bacterium]